MAALAVIAIIGAFAVGGTFANSEYGVPALFGVIGFFATFSGFAYAIYSSRRGPVETIEPETRAVEDLDSLEALEEAAELFAGSLGVSDAFRLISSRIKKMLPAHSTALMTVEDGRERLKIVQAMGEHQNELSGQTVGLGDSIAGRSFYTNIIEIGREVIDFGFPSAPVACIPIIAKGSPIAIFQIYMKRGTQFADADYEALEAIRVRITPLITSAFGLERTRTNTLTDPTTGLPNEKAFKALLAKHVSETSRKADIRPLSIISIDINDFESLNVSHGHAVGDRILEFVADVLNEDMRSMDLLARSTADEFLMIAPTATREACQDIISRIHAAFFGRRIKASENENVELSLNIGWATFGEDGESGEAMLKAARARRHQAKNGAVPKVLWFPTDRAEL